MSANKREKKPTAHRSRLAASGAPAPELASAAGLSGNYFGEVNVKSAIPRTWEERARKAVEYYQEEPLVANAINAWRTFALGDEIKVSCETEVVQEEAQEAFWRFDVNRFVKDMTLQLLVKGDAIGYFVPSKGGDDIERVICVNPISVRLRYEGDRLVEAIQRPQNLEATYGDEIPLALDQMLLVK